MGTSTVSGPFRSANGFQELVNGQWVPVAGSGGGGVPNTCFVQIPINIDCVYDNGGGSGIFKVETPFVVQDVIDSIQSNGVWAKFSGYEFTLNIARYPQPGTAAASNCFFASNSYTYSNSDSPFVMIMANPTVNSSQYGYYLEPGCFPDLGLSQTPPVTYGGGGCIGSGCNGFPYISNYGYPILQTGSCGSPFACNTDPNCKFCLVVGFCANFPQFSNGCGSPTYTEEGFVLTGMANMQFNFFNQ